jgi:hypothetical protein
MIGMWLLLFVWIAQADETIFHYTTDLSDQPTIEIEQQGIVFNAESTRISYSSPFTVWEMRWENNNAWVQHVHVHHESIEEPISTVLLGPNQSEVYLLHDHNKSRTQLLSGSGNINQITVNEGHVYRQHLLWLFGMGIVLLLLRLSRSVDNSDTPNDPTLAQPNKSWLDNTLCSLAVFSIASLFWQRGILFEDNLPARYHDALGTYWMMIRSSEWTGFIDSSTAYPTGANYRSLDSFLLWGISLLFSFVDTLQLYKGLLILGPTLSGWAAGMWAKDLGIRAPWSWIVGLTFGFSGLAENAILEGQVYQCFTAGIPFTGLFIGRYLHQPSIRNGLGAVFSFGLCLFSSSYLGASCLILLFGLWVGTGAWKRLSSLWIFAGVIPLLWVHTSWMLSTGIHEVRTFNEMTIGSVSLMNFWGSTPEMDREGHAIALGISTLSLLTTLSIPAKGLDARMKRSLYWAGGLSLILMLGPNLNLSHIDRLFVLPTSWMYQQPGLSSIGFPIRLSHPFTLAVAIFTGWGLQTMGQRNRWTLILLPLFVVEIGRRDLNFRQGSWNIDTPVLQIDSTQDEGREKDQSIFTLYPQTHKELRGSDADIILYMLDCVSQTTHEKPIANNCLSVNIYGSNAKNIQLELLTRILNQQSLQSVIDSNDIGTIVVFPELFRKTDRIRVLEAMDKEFDVTHQGNTPLQYFVYTPEENTTNTDPTFSPSKITLDLITTKDHSKPLLVLGEGVITETTLQVRAQSIRHRIEVTAHEAELPLLFQTIDGMVIWEGILYPNSTNDHMILRPDVGPQIELSLHNSPPILYHYTNWIWWLFLSLFGWALIVRHVHWLKDRLFRHATSSRPT